MPIHKIRELAQGQETTPAQFAETINSLDHFEVARLLHQLETNIKTRIFLCLHDDQKRQELLYETDEESRMEIIASLDRPYLSQFLSAMPEDEAADIIKELPAEEQEKIFSGMQPAEAGTLKSLIRHSEETAGSLMIPEFNRVFPHQQAGQLLLSLKNENSLDNPSYFYVVNDRNVLMGFFKLRDLLHVPPSTRAIQFMRKRTAKVRLDDPCEKVANLMDHEKLSSLPVVDEQNVMHGIITFDDVIRAIKDLADDDIFTMVGTARVDPFARKTLKKISARAPWLFTTFLGGMLSAFVMHFYSDLLHTFATIIFFIPFVIGLAGNVGIQGATVIVRGMANGDIQSDNLQSVVISEIWVGILNGLIFGLLCGTLLGIFSEPLLHSSPIIGLSVGLGIILAVSVSAIIGSTTPILFIKMRIDPAISTGPFVTVTNDIIGLFIYLTTSSIAFSALPR